MKEKGGHFVRAFALALAAHALLFLLFAGLIRNAAPAAAGAQPVEVQLTGMGDGGGRGPGAARAPKPPARAPAPARAPSPAVTPSVPAPTVPSQPTPPAPVPAPAASDLPSAAAWGDSNGGPEGGAGDGSGTGSGAGGGAGGAGGLPATIADIDPIPIKAIEPDYPKSASRLGQQGVVKLRADIDSQGRVVDCQVAATSGFASLDNAALQAVQSTLFWPARKSGRPIPSTIIIPIRFRLTQN